MADCSLHSIAVGIFLSRSLVYKIPVKYSICLTSDWLYISNNIVKKNATNKIFKKSNFKAKLAWKATILFAISLFTFGISVSELTMGRKTWLLSDASAVNSPTDGNESSKMKTFCNVFEHPLQDSGKHYQIICLRGEEE